MLNGLQPWHIIILVVVLIALFGAKKLPQAAKGIGESMRVFKSEAKAMRDSDEDSGGSDQAKDAKDTATEHQSEQLTSGKSTTAKAERVEQQSPSSTDSQR